jgi:hypothetical protein
MSQKQSESERPEDSPVAWFCVLERAREQNDFERAVEACQQLKRLGVKVSYSVARPGKAVANSH